MTVGFVHTAPMELNQRIHLQDLGGSGHMDSSSCLKMLECSLQNWYQTRSNLGFCLLKGCYALDVTVFFEMINDSAVEFYELWAPDQPLCSTTGGEHEKAQ